MNNPNNFDYFQLEENNSKYFKLISSNNHSYSKLINSYKTNKEKLRLINENFDAVYAPKLNENEKQNMDKNDIVTAIKPFRMFRIFVKERKNTKGEMRKIYAEFPLIEEDEIEQPAQKQQ